MENRFCKDDCRYLSITEEQQNDKWPAKPHICELYNKQVFHLEDHPKLNRWIECEMAEYTLMWTDSSGILMKHKVFAQNKKTALAIALSNPIINVYLFDYLLYRESLDAQVQQFLWLRDGRIC